MAAARDQHDYTLGSARRRSYSAVVPTRCVADEGRRLAPALLYVAAPRACDGVRAAREGDMSAKTRPMVVTFLALLLCAPGCAFVESAVNSALGRGHRELIQAQRLQRAERAGLISDAQVDQRLAFLTERLDERQFHAAAWEWSWLAIVTGGGATAAVNAGLNDSGSSHQINDIAQAGKALIGVTYLSLNPMPGIWGADPIRDMPSATRDDRLAQLAAAEDLLARQAERAHNRYSWWLHIGTVFINAAAAAPALAYGNSALAGRTFAIGVVAGEAQAWSQPWYGPADWEEYERFIETNGAPLPHEPQATWNLVPTGTGVALLGRF